MGVWAATLGCLLLTLHVVCVSGVRWCVLSDAEMTKCLAMSEAFSSASIRPSLRCVRQSDIAACAQSLRNGEVDAFSARAADIYSFGKQGDIKMAAGESGSDGEGVSYYAVAVVKKSSPSINVDSLQGRRSCHTGIDRTAGWKMPIGYLVQTSRLSVMGCDIKTGVSEFFNGSCVPGAGVPSLCSQCVGDADGNHRCEFSNNERYFSYNGAFRCLVEDAGEVAFVKHTTVQENTDGSGESWASGLHSQDYQLLCRDGSRAEVTDYRRCHLVRVPSRGIVIGNQVDGQQVYSMLVDGLKKTQFPMFQSPAGESNLLFSDSSSTFVSAQGTHTQWMGQNYHDTMAAMDCNSAELPESLRWCVLSDAEQKKCVAMATAFSSRGLTPKVQCAYGDSVTHCMKMIQAKEADAITLDGGDIFTAGKTYGLIPAAAESYDGEADGALYYAVAVLRKSDNTIRNLADLRSKRGCHTGLGRSAGWNIPIGTFIEKGLIQPQHCQIQEGAAGFLGPSCVPGASVSSLCEVCIGDENGNNKCVKDKERFEGYTGAFRCLAQGAGDVAFVKHTTVFQNTDGNNTESWAANLHSEEFQLLCPHDARAGVTQYRHCNLARVPAHAVMTHTDTHTHSLYGLLDKAQRSGVFKMFESASHGGRDLIFKDSTQRIVGVANRRTYQEWLGQEYMDTLLAMECTSAATAGQSFSSLLAFAILSSFLAGWLQ
ncbi:melanotransferrin [Engraulis encrasicolus]|uniref:melanotransferrin n=1 Tax=Engraulis encrasicolus TaxID=184585 RepID=UPI002FD4BD75